MCGNMAHENDAEFSLSKKVEVICFHCDKKVVSTVKCKKCLKLFHPACLQQASSAKKAICKHIPCDEPANLKGQDAQDLSEIRKMYQELSEKYVLLESNYQSLSEKLEKMEKVLEGHNEVPSSVASNIQTSRISTRKPATSESKIRTRQKSRTSELDPVNGNAEPTLQIRNDDGEIAQVERKTPSCTRRMLSTSDKMSDLSKSAGEKGKENQNKEDNDVVFVDSMENTASKSASGGPEYEWKTVSNRKRPKHLPENRPKPIQGVNKSSSILEVAKQFYWVFLTGLSKNTESGAILEYLESQHRSTKDIICEKMKTKSTQISSFKLRVPKQQADNILDPELWPEGIKVNHFRNLQRPQSMKVSSPEGGTR